MAVIWVHIAKRASRAVERIEPDVHLIRQVEPVTTSALGGPTCCFARIPSMGVTDALEILVFLIWQLLHCCYLAEKKPKTARRAESDPFAKGNLAMLSALNRNRAAWAAEPLLCQIR